MVARGRPQARPRLDDVELLDAGQKADRAVEQAVQAAGRHGGVVAALLGRRADDQAAVRLGHDVGARAADDVAQPERVGHADGERLPLDGPHRQRRHQPTDGGAPRARGQHDGVGRDARAVGEAQGRPGGDGLDRPPLFDLDARAPARLGERCEHGARVHLHVARRPHRRRHARRQHRLALARGVAGEPLDRHALRPLEREQPPQRRAAVAVVRHDERAGAVQPDALPGRGFELRREGRPAAQAVAPERVEVQLLEADLGRRRQHPRRRPRRAAPDGAALEHGHGGAARGEPPRHAQPGGAAAHDGHRRRRHQKPQRSATSTRTRSTSSPCATARASAASRRASPAGK